MKPTVRSLAEFRGQKCLNCDTPLDVADKYCHQCGQLNTTKRLALKDFFSEFFANFISYDSRVWLTITHVLIKPGFVTKQYCAGKRVNYANPFRFFLTVSIVFFLLLQIAIQFSDTSNIKVQPNQTDQGVFNISLSDSTDTVNERKKLIAAMEKNQDSLKEKQNLFEKPAREKATETLKKDSLSIDIGNDRALSINLSRDRKYLTQEQIDESLYSYFKQIDDYGSYHNNHKELTTEEALKKLEHDTNNTNVTRYKKAQKLNEYKNNPIEVINLILPKTPLFLFFFAPIMSLFFWLIYARGKWNYMEHMVFNFHLLTFVFLILYLVLAELTLFGSGYIATISFFIIGPFYLYKAMRKFYQQKRFKTILKFLFINFVFFVLLLVSSTIFMVASVYLSA